LALVEIVDITTEAHGDVLLGCHLDAPGKGAGYDAYGLTIQGWLAAKSSRVAEHRLTVVVEAEFGDRGSSSRTVRRLAEATADVERPDLDERFQGQDARASGFSASLSVLGLPTEHVLLVGALVPGAGTVPIARIRVKRSILRSAFRPRLQPVLIFTVGRAGSRWFTRLLGDHPQAVTYRPLGYEPRVMAYWLSVLASLSQPASYLQAVDPDRARAARYWWAGQGRERAGPPLHEDPVVRDSLGRDSVEELAVFCQERIEQFYEDVARAEGKDEVRVFAERAPHPAAMSLVDELYRNVRQVFLVRDFRDVVCSRFAFSEKEGAPLFGRDFASSDEQYVQEIMGKQVKSFLAIWNRRREDSHLVRYEDLVADTEATLARLFDYLQLDSSHEVLGGLSESSDSAAELDHATSESAEASIGRWQSEMTPSLVKACEGAFADALQAFGYR
jgi:hypothetical protein